MIKIAIGKCTNANIRTYNDFVEGKYYLLRLSRSGDKLLAFKWYEWVVVYQNHTLAFDRQASYANLRYFDEVDTFWVKNYKELQNAALSNQFLRHHARNHCGGTRFRPSSFVFKRINNL